MKTNNQNNQGYGYFRKSKAYGLVCAIALAGAFAFGTAQVNADEVTAPTPEVVTTLTTPTNNQAQPVTLSELDKSVTEAKEAGVKVTTTAPVAHVDVLSAQNDLTNQEKAVEEATAKAEANATAIKTATEVNAKIDAENQAEVKRVAEANKAGQLAVDTKNTEAKAQVEKANKDAQAQADATNAKLKADYETKLAEIKTVEDYNKAVAERNALAKQAVESTNAKLKAEYETKLKAYNQALADRVNLVAKDVTFEGFGKSEMLEGYGQKTTDTVKVDTDGNFVITEPQADTDGVFANTKVKGKFIYTVTFDSATNNAIIKITGINLTSWQLDLIRPTTAINRNVSTSYKDLAGNVLYTRNFDGLSSIGVQTINKSFALDKSLTLSNGQTSEEIMFLKTEPKWILSAPSSLYAKLTYKTAVLPENSMPPVYKTVTPEAEKPVPQTPPVPVYVTPELKTFTPEVYTPIKPTVKPHVAVPEKLTVTVSVHPVLVPVANPSKDVVDEAGKSINGLSVLPNTDLNYVAKQDFSQYKGMTANKDAVAKNFIFIDDYKDEALNGKSMTVNSIKASNGQDVSNLLEMHHVLSKEALDAKLQAIIAESGLSPVGEFYIWVAKDPASFYQTYVQKGLDITYNLSFKVNPTFTEGQIVNGVAQIDFGNGYLGNIVVNDLPKPEVHKDVLDKQDGKSINNGTVKLGDEVTYKLEGWVIPTGRSYDLFEYKFVDQLQHSHDLYLKDSVVAKVDITLTDGTVIPKGSDLGQYTETTYNKETGLYELTFKKDFLAKVVRSSEFGADAFLVAKRIKAGDVYNTTEHFVNGHKVKSETVVTHTPEKPQPPKSTTPKKMLPHAGEQSMGLLTAVGAGIISMLGLAGIRRKKN
ncbi:LPXTG cell wall anchor domain-containing protein [Streptococcus iniae]|uniref:SspB-related isopeptide-forming adhesin n=1 Tax=Streptococcus iniae TaxID=1346 RepID=UPI0002DF996B|nr:SspB-related isopeptide-forming adhesin [Streptococcus iniae]ESR10535.1 cell wall surface anchor protein [Streptococcus iniae IUSA1]KYJ81223.1 cell surface protein [Streptococcus iniae]RMI72630.1 LPXTG cell wall anchor domain-containing protein [Streptococcus iniae]HEK4517250.1 LPXTG cell wall anchor domain-containing protein [Streptococcus iniae]